MAKAKAVKRVLEEVLLVAIKGKNGVEKEMTVSREFFDNQKKDLDIRVVRIIKPEGVTMEEHLKASAAEKKATTPAKKAPAKKAPAKKAPADPDEDQVKAEIEAQSMQELLNSKK
jgi:hypothetical protein